MKNTLLRALQVAALVVAASSLTSCALFSWDEELTVEQKELALDSTLDGISKNYLTIYSGSTVKSLANALNTLGYPVTSELDLNALRYTGKTLKSVDALTVLEIVMSNTVMDFDIDVPENEIRIKQASYENVKLLVDMTDLDWEYLDQKLQFLTIRVINEEEYELGVALNDKITHSYYINAPLPTRRKMLNTINEFKQWKGQVKLQ